MYPKKCLFPYNMPMKKLLLAALLAVLIQPATALSGDLVISDGKAPNPWTSLDIKDGSDTVRFAVISDRNGGVRPGVMPEVLKRVNLLAPQFTMSVGDFITGYMEDRPWINRDWDEVMKEISILKTPFFYTVGNHDQTNPVEAEEWVKRLGRSYYHFTYKNVLFLVVNSEDGGIYSNISQAQLDYFQKALAENPKPRWTFVFLHKPLWGNRGAMDGATDDMKKRTKGVEAFAKFEEMLKGRKFTLFCGHTHQYSYEVRNGNKYYNLATSGAGSDMRGPAFGEFDQFVMVTVGEGEPVVANLNIEGFMEDDLVVPGTRDIPDKLKDSAPRQRTALVSLVPDVDTIDMKFSSKNSTTIPVTVSLVFGRTAPFKLVANPLETVIKPGKEVDLHFVMKAPHAVPIAEVGAIPYEWTVTAAPKGKRPIVMTGKADIGYDQLRPVERAAAPVSVDGSIGEWKELPYALTEVSDNAQQKGLWKNPKDLSAYFNVSYDDQFVYAAVKVADDSIRARAGEDPWNQDGIGIFVEGRQEADWSPDQPQKGQGLFLSPGKDAKSTIAWGTEWMPAGIKYACVTAKGGYNAEIAIPIAELEATAGKPWKALRVNVSLYDFDSDNGMTGTYMSWMTDWKDPSSHPGSGAFIRK